MAQIRKWVISGAVSPTMHDAITLAARREQRSVSNFARVLLTYAWKRYQKDGIIPLLEAIQEEKRR